jgi:acetate---CoA ligase (ADP-forming)
MTNKTPDIRTLFEPRSIAVIGASHNPAKIGSKILKNIVESGFKGKIYPVNPKGGEIQGIPAFTSVAEISGEIDIACTCVPAKFVPQSIRETADAGTRFNLVITSGFSEVGNIEEEREFTEYARSKGMRIIGPNIFGMYSATASLDATFGPGGIVPGEVAIITQSGALGLAMIGKTANENIGLSAMVSVGNKADMGETDLLEYLMDDPNTKSILMYVEGVKEGSALVDVLKRATRKKPVVIIKSGRSQRGAAAAASHTGSLAGSDDVFEAIMSQCGVHRAESVKDGFNLCKFLSSTAIPKGRNTVIVTNGGGIGVMATDACEKYGVTLFDDAEYLKEVFGPVTPDFGSTKNPIDLTGGAGADFYDQSLAAAAASEHIDAVIALYCETAVFDATDLAPMIRRNCELFKKAGKPIVFSAFGGERIDVSLDQLSKERLPVYGDVYEAVYSMGGIYRQYETARHQPSPPEKVEIDLAAIDKIVAGARADDRTFLLADEGRAVMEAAGIAMPGSKIARNMKMAIQMADEIGYPVVMKVVSRDILHKSDSGGVALNLLNREEVIDAYQAIMRSCLAAVPNAHITGIEVAEMVQSGLEVIVGARRDPGFGPIIMFGQGGIYVEVLKDVTFRSAPVSRPEALEMMQDIRAYPLLLGVRGEQRRDIESVVDSIIKLASLIDQCVAISDIEVNPIVVYEEGDGSRAVDARILLSRI